MKATNTNEDREKTRVIQRKKWNTLRTWFSVIRKFTVAVYLNKIFFSSENGRISKLW